MTSSEEVVNAETLCTPCILGCVRCLRSQGAPGVCKRHHLADVTQLVTVVVVSNTERAGVRAVR